MIRLVLSRRFHVVLGPLRRPRFRFPPAWADAIGRFNRGTENAADRLAYYRRVAASKKGTP